MQIDEKNLGQIYIPGYGQSRDVQLLSTRKVISTPHGQ